jgi:two-component system, response regulator PdtaR
MAHLLIVEDDAITALALQHAVTQMGHQVVARTASAAAAMAAVQAYRPDAVLLDRGLAGAQDGLMVGTDIQALWATPVIYLSGYDPVQLALSGYDPVQLALPEFPEALYCVLAKPLDWDQLRDTLAHLFPAQPVRRTAQELRERLSQLRAHLAALPRHRRHRR